MSPSANVASRRELFGQVEAVICLHNITPPMGPYRDPKILMPQIKTLCNGRLKAAALNPTWLAEELGVELNLAEQISHILAN